MTPEEKIAKVLKQIKNEAAINPDPRLMRFELNNFIVGAGILTDDEERRILFKLQKEGVIKLRLLQYEDSRPREVAVISSVEGNRYMTSPYYWVEMCDSFDSKYENFSKYLSPEKPKMKTGMKEKNSGKSPLVTIYGDFISGDKVGRDKKIEPNTPQSWLSKYWWGFVIPIIVVVIGFIITEGKIPQLFGVGLGTSITEAQLVATSTVSLADILSKALTLETVVERQDFLKKYIGSTVIAQGTVSEVSRSGAGGFLIDLKVAGQTVTCPQEAGEENEKQLLLLKGKRVQVVGKFPFSEIWGHGLGIEECVLARL